MNAEDPIHLALIRLYWTLDQGKQTDETVAAMELAYAALYPAEPATCPHTSTHVDPDSFIYDHHVCDKCGRIVQSE